jgi:hypothetical protein
VAAPPPPQNVRQHATQSATSRRFLRRLHDQSGDTSAAQGVTPAGLQLTRHSGGRARRGGDQRAVAAQAEGAQAQVLLKAAVSWEFRYDGAQGS